MNPYLIVILLCAGILVVTVSLVQYASVFAQNQKLNQLRTLFSRFGTDTSVAYKNGDTSSSLEFVNTNAAFFQSTSYTFGPFPMYQLKAACTPSSTANFDSWSNVSNYYNVSLAATSDAAGFSEATDAINSMMSFVIYTMIFFLFFNFAFALLVLYVFNTYVDEQHSNEDVKKELYKKIYGIELPDSHDTSSSLTQKFNKLSFIALHTCDVPPIFGKPGGLQHWLLSTIKKYTDKAIEEGGELARENYPENRDGIQFKEEVN